MQTPRLFNLAESSHTHSTSGNYKSDLSLQTLEAEIGRPKKSRKLLQMPPRLRFWRVR